MKVKFEVENGAVGADGNSVDMHNLLLRHRLYFVMDGETERTICKATAFIDKGVLYAECDLPEDYLDRYPAIMYSISDGLIGIALELEPVLNPTIKTIREQI